MSGCWFQELFRIELLNRLNKREKSPLFISDRGLCVTGTERMSRSAARAFQILLVFYWFFNCQIGMIIHF